MPTGEYYALMLFSIVGMMLMGSTRDLLVIFMALEIMSLGVYVLTAIKRASEEGAEAALQVLRARRVLERVLPVRHRAGLRGHRHDEDRRDRHAAWPRPAQQPDMVLLLVLSMILLHRRLRVQGVGGAVPHVDAGRLPGRADAGDRLHVHGA